MEPGSTQPSLLVRLRDPSDRNAWRSFDGKYGDLVIGYCRSCGLQLSDAEDVRQLVMLNLTRAMPGFDYQPGRGRFRNYFRTVVRHAIARHLGRHTTSETVLDREVLDGFPVAQSDGPDAKWEAQWTRHHCRMALRTLRRSYDSRSVAVFDRLLSGESIRSVAETFAMSEEAVRKAKQRVKERLQVIIARQIQEEETHG